MAGARDETGGGGRLCQGRREDRRGPAGRAAGEEGGPRPPPFWSVPAPTEQLDLPPEHRVERRERQRLSEPPRAGQETTVRADKFHQPRRLVHIKMPPLPQHLEALDAYGQGLEFFAHYPVTSLRSSVSGPYSSRDVLAEMEGGL